MKKLATSKRALSTNAQYKRLPAVMGDATGHGIAGLVNKLKSYAEGGTVNQYGMRWPMNRPQVLSPDDPNFIPQPEGGFLHQGYTSDNPPYVTSPLPLPGGPIQTQQDVLDRVAARDNRSFQPTHKLTLHDDPALANNPYLNANSPTDYTTAWNDYITGKTPFFGSPSVGPIPSNRTIPVPEGRAPVVDPRTRMYEWMSMHGIPVQGGLNPGNPYTLPTYSNPSGRHVPPAQMVQQPRVDRTASNIPAVSPYGIGALAGGPRRTR